MKKTIFALLAGFVVVSIVFAVVAVAIVKSRSEKELSVSKNAVTGTRSDNSNESLVSNSTTPVEKSDAQPVGQSNSWIIYSSDQETTNSELYYSKVDGSQRTRLTNDSNYSNAWPRVTPDGKTVYFYRVPAGTKLSTYTSYALWRVNLDGSGLVELLPKGNAGWFLQGHVDISYDGKQIVFGAFVPGAGKGLTMYLADLDAKNLKAIPTKTQKPIDPAWTPDGRIVFTAIPPGLPQKDANMEVYITSPNGQGEKRLTDDNFRDHDPAMSPNGKQILVLTQTDPTYLLIGKWVTRIMKSDGSNIKTMIGDDHYTANARWVDNETVTYSYIDVKKGGWGIQVAKIDGSKIYDLVPPKKVQGRPVAYLESPFAFNK